MYQDLMVFKNLFKGSYFGGRSLVAERNMKNVKKQIKRENNLFSAAQTNSYYNRHMMTKRSQDRISEGKKSKSDMQLEFQHSIPEENEESRQSSHIMNAAGSSLLNRAHSSGKNTPDLKLNQ